MQHGQLSDAACVDVRQSPGIQTMLTAMRIMQMLKGGFKYDLLDNRWGPRGMTVAAEF